MLTFLDRKYRRRNGDHRQRGFSLIELLVALAIMAILVTLVAPRLFNQVDRAKVQAAQTQAQTLKTSMNALRLDLGRYPTEREGLQLLISPPSDPSLEAQWYGPYIDGELPSDPWGRPFIYLPPVTDDRGRTGSPKIISYGADGAPGGSGMDADIET